MLSNNFYPDIWHQFHCFNADLRNWTDFCRSADIAGRRTLPVGGLSTLPADFAGRRTLPVGGLCRSAGLWRSADFAGRRTLPVGGLCRSADFAVAVGLFRSYFCRSDFAGRNFASQTFAIQTVVSQTFAGQTFAGWTFAGMKFTLSRQISMVGLLQVKLDLPYLPNLL